MALGMVDAEAGTERLRVILHADMDAFYAAVEQLDRPELRGRPVVVGGDGRRGVVSTASYEARRFGVHSAMPGRRARQLCPDAIFVPVRMARYVAVSRQVRAVFDRFTPLVEPLSLDEAFLDVTGSQRLFGDGESIAEQIRAQVRDVTGGLTVSVGVASSKFVAKVASDLRKPDGLVVVPAGEDAEFLAPLPIKRMWGAGPVAQERLAALGIDTIGQLREWRPETLAVRLGKDSARRFYRLAGGEDDRPVVPEREAKSIGRETTFEDDLRDSEQLHQVLLHLCEDVGRRLRSAGKVAGVVRLKLRFPPFETHGKQRAVTGLDDDLGLFEVARELFDELRGKRRAVRLVGVTAAALHDAGVPDAPKQGELFGAAELDAPADAEQVARRQQLDRAVDALRERFGKGVIRRGG